MRLRGYIFPLLLLFVACSGSKTISSSGLSYARLGEPMPAVGASSIGGHSLRDTVFQQGGYEWRAAIVGYGNQGKVYLEDGFWGEGKVNRIRVESPKLRVKGADQLRVGMAWEVLQGLGQDWEMTYLADFGLTDVFSPSFPRMHFLIREVRQAPEVLQAPEAGTALLSPDAVIAAIVLM